METIPFKDCIKIGFLHKPHSVQGRISIIFFEEFEKSVEEARTFFINVDGGLVPFFIEDDDIVINSAKRATVKFKWVDSEEKAREFAGFEVWLKQADIKDIQKETSVNDLKGYVLYNSQNERIGEILNIENFSGNIVFTIDYAGREILVPFNENLLDKINTAVKTLYLRLPEGLLDQE